jgi:hypothetical protein
LLILPDHEPKDIELPVKQLEEGIGWPLEKFQERKENICKERNDGNRLCNERNESSTV